jgi:hypothetical protein
MAKEEERKAAAREKERGRSEQSQGFHDGPDGSRRLTALLVDYFELECLAVGASLACVVANDTISIG